MKSYKNRSENHGNLFDHITTNKINAIMGFSLAINRTKFIEKV